MAAMLKGKWALVTGSRAGLGLALAESLAGAGANVVLHDLAEPDAARDSIRSRFGIDAISVAADLTQRSAIEQMMDTLLGRLGAIDILVNNAVVRHFAPVERFPPERWEEALAVNLTAPFHLIRLALPAMKRRGWGRIVNMASIYSTRAVENRIDYVTTKAAIPGMTRAVAIETATSGITCNALCPGVLPTPAIESRIAAIAASQNLSVEQATRDYLASRQPNGRFISTGNVGAMLVFLCSPAAQDITGAALPIDGGWSASS
jgi:3-hydroxybutyrate dehydrogenase